MDDNLYSDLGCKILDIIRFCDMIILQLTSTSNKQYRTKIIRIKDKYFLSNNRQSVVKLPAKLPMIYPPKHSGPNVLGSYYLNDKKFADELFIENKAYACNSKLNGTKFYTSVNK